MTTHSGIPKKRFTSRPRTVDTRFLDDDAHVRIDTVARECSLQPGTIRNLLSSNARSFPAPVPKAGAGPNYWRLGDVRDWLRKNRGQAASNP
jgi:hypothetical protein